MLVLSRKTGQRIHIGDQVTISVVRISGNRVRIGIEAPIEVPIHRLELDQQISTLAEELPTVPR
jgi:carbon storage regulator